MKSQLSLKGFAITKPRESEWLLEGFIIKGGGGGLIRWGGYMIYKFNVRLLGYEYEKISDCESKFTKKAKKTKRCYCSNTDKQCCHKFSRLLRICLKYVSILTKLWTQVKSPPCQILIYPTSSSHPLSNFMCVYVCVRACVCVCACAVFHLSCVNYSALENTH